MKKQHYAFACSFFFSMGGNTLGFSLIYRLTDRLAFSPGQVGRYMALGQLFFFFGCNLYHRFGSSFKPIKVFGFSAFMAFLCALVLGFARTSSVIYVSYWILQTGSGLFWPSIIVWMTEGFAGKELSREISLYNRSWLTANMLGPLVAGVLYEWNSALSFIILDLCYFMILFLLYMRRRNIQKNGVEETPVQTAVSVNTGPETGKTLFDPGDKKSDFYRYRSWIGVFCSAIFMGILINILPLHIRDGMGFSERTAGLVLFFRCATGLVGFTILARITSWHYNRRWFIILQCGLILSSFLFLVAGNRLLIYFMIAMLYGIIHCSCSNNSLFYSGSSGKNSKKNLAIHEMINSFGSASGTAAGGFLYQRFRFTGVCLVLLLFYGAGLWIIFTLNKRETRLAAGS